MTLRIFKRQISPLWMLVVSFGGLIVIGSFLLFLPLMQNDQKISFLDCIFTATSAVCVTGLVTVDTVTSWSFWGQVLICLLFQLGGLGIMTFSVAMLYLTGFKPGIMSHRMLSGSLGPTLTGEIGKLTKNIILYTFLLEIIGAFILTIRFMYQFPYDKAFFLGIFHAISAFCNAGFSLFPSSLEFYSNDPLINITVALLIILGGLGFLVLREVMIWIRFRGRRYVQRLSLHAQIVLTFSIVLIFGGTVVLWCLEFWVNDNLFLNIWSACFTSISRTAGFCMIDIEYLSNASILVIIVLMFIGASPGSTGGGIKTTALATLFAVARTRLKGLSGAHIYNRNISDKQIGEVFALVTCSFFVLIFSVIVLTILETGDVYQGHIRANILAYAFEVVSAFSTVGLSMGITSTLSSGGKVLLIFLMIMGRLGPLTFIYALIYKSRSFKYQLANERITLG